MRNLKFLPYNTIKVVKMLVIVLSVIVTTIALIKYNLFKRKMERYVKHLPIAHPTMPLIGNALSFWCDTTTELFEEMTSGFNKVDTPSKAYMGPYLVVNLDKPDDIKTVLMSSDCHNKPYFYQLLGNTQGLFTMKCKLWCQFHCYQLADS